MLWWVDASWAKAAIKRPEKKWENTSNSWNKITRSTEGNQGKYPSSSEALISVELEVDDALYLEHSNDSEYLGGRTSGRKTKTV